MQKLVELLAAEAAAQSTAAIVTVTVTVTWFRICLNTPWGANAAHGVPVS
jgi:hypothetical protein